MPDVFTDEVGTYDLTITTSADWTVSSGGMPNGDNYVTADGTVAATYNLNGDDFNFADGTAWTLECWFYYTTAGAATQLLIGNYEGTTGTANWTLAFGSAEIIQFVLYNTTPAIGMDVSSAVLTTSTWHHIVVVKETGNVLRLYVDGAEYVTDSTVSGTLRTPTSSARIYLGTAGDGTLDLGVTAGSRLSKVAIYNRQLSAGEITDHYTAMTAA